MYEHPYLSQRVAELEIEQVEREAERRRFIAEHADQIVPRPAGALRRVLRRIAGGTAAADAAARGSEAAAPRTDAVAPRRATTPCGEPATAR